MKTLRKNQFSSPLWASFLANNISPTLKPLCIWPSP